MPIPRSNSLLPLAGETPQIFGSIRDAKQQGAQIKATEARTSFLESQEQAVEDQRQAIADEARQEAAREAEFESIVRGVNELEPLMPKGINDVPAFIAAAEKRSANIRSTGGRSDDTDGIIQMARAGDFDGIRSQFDQVREIHRQRQFERFGAEAPNAQGADSFTLSGGQTRFDAEGNELASVAPSEGEIPASIQDRNSLIGDFSEEDQVSARRIEAGLDPRAVGSANITTATDPNLTDQVAESQAQIREATKFGELTGSSRAAAIDKGFEAIQSIAANNRNMDRAITELQNGASTGAIEQFIPSIEEATLRLENIQGELALDVVGSITFGALSKGELDLAKTVAVPTGLQPAELITYFQEKKAANEKLSDYYAEQIDFLDQGGTVAGFIREKKRQLEANKNNPDTEGDLTPEEQAELDRLRQNQ